MRIGPASACRPSSNGERTVSTRPPARSRASRTTTWRPACRRRSAARNPARPAPTTTTGLSASPGRLGESLQQRRRGGSRQGGELEKPSTGDVSPHGERAADAVILEQIALNVVSGFSRTESRSARRRTTRRFTRKACNGHEERQHLSCLSVVSWFVSFVSLRLINGPVHEHRT